MSQQYERHQTIHLELKKEENPKKRKITKIKRNNDFQRFFLNILDFEVWVKDSKIFDLRFGFLVKKCMYFTPGTPKTVGARTLITGGGVC